MRLDHIYASHMRASNAPNASLKVVQKRIAAGDLCVDGTVTLEPKRQIVPGVEVVTLAASGAVVSCGDHAFFLMNKPEGYVCQKHPHEPNVYQLVPDEHRHIGLACVGRLDRDTTGTLLFGTDGGVQSLLLFPTSNCWKEYLAECTGRLQSDAASRFRDGLELEDGTRCAPATLDVLCAGDDERGERVRVRVTLHEGFFHQVPRNL